MAVAGELLVKMVLDGEVYAREMRKIRNANENLERQFQTLSNLGGQVLTRGIQALTVAFAGLSYQVVKTGAEFEQTITTLAAIKGVATENVSALEEQARLLGRTTAYTATEAAAGMQELARAGMDTNEILEVSSVALQFAGANAMSMTKSTETLATTFAQFGLNASAGTRVADTFTVAAQNSLFTVEQLASSMKYAGTVGNAYNMSLEETTASLAEFRELGLKGMTAGTQFRQALIALAAPTEKAKKVLDKYNLSVDDVNVKLHGFKGVMETIGKTGMDITDITALVSKRAAASVTTISKNMAKAASDPTMTTKYDELLNKFDEGAGRTAATYAQMIDTLQGKFAILKSVYEEALLSVFDAAGPKLNVFIEELTGALTMVYKLIQINSEAVGAAIQNLLDSFRQALGGVVEAEGEIEDRQAAIASSITIAIIKVTNLVASFVRMIPVLVKIGKALVVIFVAGKIRAFSAGIAGLIVEMARLVPAFAAAGTAAAGFQRALLGPIGAALSLAAALGTMLFASQKATRGQDQTARAAEFQEKYIKSSAKGLARHIKVMNSWTAAYVNQNRSYMQGGKQYKVIGKDLNEIDGSRITIIRQYLKDNDKLDIGLKNSLSTTQQILRGKKEDIQQSIIEGKLINVSILQKGELVQQLLTVDAARRLEATNLTAFNRTHRKSNDIIAESKTELDNLKEAFNQVNNRGLSVKQFNIWLRQWPLLKKYGLENAKTWQDVNKQGKSLSETIDVLTSRYEFLAKSQKISTDQMAEDAKALAEEEKKKAKAEKKAAGQDWYKKYMSNIRSIEGAESKLARRLAVLEAEKNKNLTIGQEHRLEDLRKTYKKAIDMTYKWSKKRLEIEKRFLLAVRSFNKVNLLSLQKDSKKRIKDREKELLRTKMNEEELEKDSFKSAKEELNKRYELEKQTLTRSLMAEDAAAQKILDAEKAQAKKRYNLKKITLTQYNNWLAKAQADFAAKDKLAQDASIKDAADMKKRKDKETEALEALHLSRMKGLSDAHVQNALEVQKTSAENYRKLGPIARLKNEKKAALELAKIHKDGSQERTQIEEAYTEAIKYERLKLLEDYATPYGKHTATILGLQKKLATSIFVLDRDSLEKRVEYLSEKAELEKRLIKIRMEMQGASEEDVRAAQAETFQKLGILEQKQMNLFVKFFAVLKNGLSSYADALKKTGSTLWGITKLLSDKDNWAGALYVTVDAIVNIDKHVKKAWKSFKGVVSSLDNWKTLGKLTFKAMEKGVQSLLPLLQNITKVFYKVGESAFSVGKQLASGFAEGISFLTGGVSLSIADVLSGGLNAIQSASDDLKSEKDNLQKMLDDGELSQADFEKSVADLDKKFSPAEVGKKYVDEMINAGVAFAESIIESAPTILQRFGEKLPILLKKAAESIPILVKAIADNAPIIISALIDGFINALDSLVSALVTVLPQLVESLITVIGEKLPSLADKLFELAFLLIKAIIDLMPQLIEAFMAMAPKLFGLVVDLINMLIMQLPTLIDAFLQALPTIIDAVLMAIPKILVAIVSIIPKIIQSFIDNLPAITQALIDGLIAVLYGLIQQLPILIDGIIELMPLLIDSLIEAALQVVTALISALPDIISALINMIPTLIKAFISTMPMLIIGITKALPQIAIALVKAIVTELLPALPGLAWELAQAIAEGVGAAIRNIGRMLWDLIQEIWGMLPWNDNPETKTFGDTPHAIRVGPRGMTARFATDDYVVAAKNPMELVRQSFEAADRNGQGSSMNTAPPSQSSAPIDIAIMAEGRLLDAVQVTALNRGHAPKLKQILRKTSGVKVGFNRGRYNKFTA